MRLNEYASTRRTRGSYKIPTSVQKSIPIDEIYADGTWRSGEVYSQMWSVSDINYAMQSDDKKQDILAKMGRIYSNIPTDCWAQLCIVSQRMDEISFERDVLYHRANDGLDAYRVERNRLMKAYAKEIGNVKQQKYLILSTNKQNSKDATAAGNTAPIVTHAPKLPTINNKQATVEAISRGVHYIAAKIKALLSQTVRRAAQSLLALLGAGGVVLVLAMVIGAAAAVIGSPMGILFADESNDPNSIPIAEIVAETNADFGAAINDIVSAHPECSETTITYDYEGGHTWASYWPEVLAVFAVHTNLNSDSDVVVINAAQKQRIQDTFWAMHTITYEVGEVDVTPDPTEDDPEPEQQTEYILHITVSSKTVDKLAELYNFTQDQKDILHELLSDEMRPTLLALCGGSIGIIEDGELCWPLPGHTYISCNFGDDDAYGNSGHRGTDIPAPEGTPILAAHSGTVIISGWNNSYGNQVLLDNGAGLSTRYAHMTAAAVSAGETVTAGQVIGYVGNTGDSTGFHLHFEVMQNGVRVNPLDAVTPQ